MNWPKATAALVAAVAVGAGLSGCGDRITATKTWGLENVKESLTPSGQRIAAETITADAGPGTAFWEYCRYLPTNGPARTDCLVIFNAGHKTYVASGRG